MSNDDTTIIKTLMLFRCTKRDWAEQFCNGKIYLSTPQKWIDIEKEGNKGQGDILEGVFFSCKKDDNSSFIKQVKNNNSVEHFDIGDTIFFRRKDVVSLRCLCLYGLHNTAFQKKKYENGRVRSCTSIPRSYFSSFSACGSRDEFEEIDYNEQPVVIFIKNPNEFFRRVIDSLVKMGISKDDVVVSPVVYGDKNTYRIYPIDSPKELLFKDKFFEDQSEVRIIVNNRDRNFQELMTASHGVIEVGSLEDITSVYDFYFDDLSIEIHGSNSISFSLPQSQSTKVSDMNFYELLDLVSSITKGDTRIDGIPPDSVSWKDKLQSIIEIFNSKWGIVLNIDDDGRISLQNVSSEVLDQSPERRNRDRLLGDFERRIDSLIEEKKYDEALKICDESLNNMLLQDCVYYSLGKTYKAIGRDGDAINAYIQSINRDYKRVESMDEIASVFFVREEYEKAIEVYNSIQDEIGYDIRVWFNLALCYLHLKRYDLSIDCFDKAISMNVNDAASYYNKGVALFESGNTNEAKLCMEKAISLDPRNEFYIKEYNKSFIKND